MANYDRPYKFNIVLNSQQVSAQSSGNDNDCTYEFNWTNIPSGKYRMSFSYKGKNNDVFFNSEPTNGPIRVQIFRDNFTTPFTTRAGSNIAEYVLVLSFDQIGKVYPYNL